jgi:hypothetical protein
MQVRLMNSYMLPQGTRMVARPRSTMQANNSPMPRYSTASPARPTRSSNGRCGLSATMPGVLLSVVTPPAATGSSWRVRT